MSELARVADVIPLEGHWIRVTFSDGAVMDIGLEGMFSGGPIFEPILSNRDLFEQVRVNPHSRTVEWPGEVDVDPDVLYGRFKAVSGRDYERRIVREPTLSRA